MENRRWTMFPAIHVYTLFFACLTICHAGRVQVMNCHNVVNKVENVTVEVSDCPDGSNCTLYRGNTYDLKTTFSPKENFRVVNMRTLGVMGLLKVPYMGHSPVCLEATTEDGENCDPEVGLVEGKSYTHVKDFPVKRIYPEMSIRARVEYFNGVRSHRRNIILCYEIPIRISKPPEVENEVAEST